MRLSFFAKPHRDWVVEGNHTSRVMGFGLIAFVLAVHMLGRGYSELTWALLGLQFLAYPQLLYWRTRKSNEPRAAEMNHMSLDSFVFGMWSAYLGFPMWSTFGMCVTTAVTHASYMGVKGAVRSAAALSAGALMAIVLFGFRFSPAMDWPISLACLLGLTAYLVSLANMAHNHNVKLFETRDKMRKGEQALQEANEALRQQLGEISVLQTRLREQANRDSLTGLYNRRYLDDTLARELARCKREGQPLSLMLIDIDHFKRVNDTYGHPAGDEVLRALARMLNTHARSGDVACRYGGEEFLMLLPHMPLQTAMQRAEQWRADFGTATLVFGDFHIQATLSVGIATYPGDGTSPETLIANADLALYRAKNNGRNRVVAFSTSHPSPSVLPNSSHASQ
ncbi:sensor domain-containing diguanylate cyclase [Rhodoferax saidenbachensis]|uniref:diguanylate cyclase n=1 Tax=Rhodoferax saidenbachensis TaxID=1484693 RepID=A0A1P8KEL0_9BURK|nr:sensor domain-containing diguanylate cyclase [Rhodoferax saidenbachensis]APW44401.1 diguanylate cyclase AdrA [Rhodoferax saidenbachensis]